MKTIDQNARRNSGYERYLKRIRQIAPDLIIDDIEINLDGLANEVVIINGEVVFRFAKGEFGRESLARELKALKALRGQITLAVPEPFYTSEDAIAYRFLPGESLTRMVLGSLNLQEQQVIADQLSEFLHAMHSIGYRNLPATSAPVDLVRLQDQHKRIQEKIYPLLLPDQVAWADGLFAFLDQPAAFDYEPRLIHGDLAPYHLLYNPQSKRLGGVIDFGVSGLGDPAADISTMLREYGFRFVQRMELCYPGLIEFLPRAQFYAQEIEFQWVLRGIESGDQFWFTAHLGGARDY